MKSIIKRILIMFMVISVVGCSGATSSALKEVTNETITLNIPNTGSRTGTYTGTVNKDGVPEGKGKFTTKNSAGSTWYYEGDFVNGLFEGTGVQEWPETTPNVKYEGLFTAGKMSEGKCYYDKVLLYEGGFKNDIYDGAGKLYDAAGEVTYEGEFSSGKPVDANAFKKKCKSMKYSDIARDPTNHFGKLVKVSAKIYEVVGGGSRPEYIVSMDHNNDQGLYVFYTMSASDKRLLEEDDVTIYGVLTHEMAAENIFGGTEYYPLLNAMFIELK